MWEWEGGYSGKPPIYLWEFAICLGPTKEQPVSSLLSTLFLRGEVRTRFQSDLTMFPSFCGFQSVPCSLVEEIFFRCGLNT